MKLLSFWGLRLMIHLSSVIATGPPTSRRSQRFMHTVVPFLPSYSIYPTTEAPRKEGRESYVPTGGPNVANPREEEGASYLQPESDLRKHEQLNVGSANMRGGKRPNADTEVDLPPTKAPRLVPCMTTPWMTKETKYLCGYCGEPFSLRRECKEHIKTHKGGEMPRITQEIVKLDKPEYRIYHKDLKFFEGWDPREPKVAQLQSSKHLLHNIRRNPTPEWEPREPKVAQLQSSKHLLHNIRRNPTPEMPGFEPEIARPQSAKYLLRHIGRIVSPENKVSKTPTIKQEDDDEPKVSLNSKVQSVLQETPRIKQEDDDESEVSLARIAQSVWQEIPMMEQEITEPMFSLSSIVEAVMQERRAERDDSRNLRHSNDSQHSGDKVSIYDVDRSRPAITAADGQMKIIGRKPISLNINHGIQNSEPQYSVSASEQKSDSLSDIPPFTYMDVATTPYGNLEPNTDPGTNNIIIGNDKLGMMKKRKPFSNAEEGKLYREA